MINLIPVPAKKTVKIEYWLRVITSWSLLWAFALVLCVGIIVPAYALITIQVAAYEDTARIAEESVQDYEIVSRALTDASRQAVFVLNNDEKEPMHEYIALFKSLEGSEITIAELSVKRSEQGIAPVVISGEAADREQLAAFRDRLLAEEGIVEVDLPISNLAKDRDIQFTLTVTMNNG